MTAGRRRRAVVASLAAAAGVALGGCGASGEGAAADPLVTAGPRLASVRSGELHLRVAASAAGQDGRPVGFDIAGAFALADADGELPRARLRLTPLAGGEQPASVFVSDGRSASVEANGQVIPVPDEQIASMRGKADGGALRGLDLASWVQDAVRTDGGTLDGVAVTRLNGRADVPVALADLFALAGSVGGTGLPRLERAEADQLRNAVRSSHVEVLTGAKDGIPRTIRLVVEFAVSDPALARTLGPLAGARLEVLLDVRRPNQPVDLPNSST